MLDILGEAWIEVIGSGKVSLRDLCRNDCFWQGHHKDRGLPPGGYYHVGGAFAGYLVEAHGIELLKEIFRNSHYRDQHLDTTLERLTGTSVEDLAVKVGSWWERRAFGNEADVTNVR